MLTEPRNFLLFKNCFTKCSYLVKSFVKTQYHRLTIHSVYYSSVVRRINVDSEFCRQQITHVIFRRGLGGDGKSRDSKVGHPLVIGHRGASGYVPEHTLASYAVAILMGAEYIEPDFVPTRDHQIVARHENELSLSTDVSIRPEFASRCKSKTIDGLHVNGWFTEDFTLEELKTLQAIERIPDIRPENARYNGVLKIATLQEIIDLVKCLQMNLKRDIGIIADLKHSSYFRQIGLPMEELVVKICKSNGYVERKAPFCIQSFEISNLKLLQSMTKLELMQLYDLPTLQPYDEIIRGSKLTYGDMATPKGLREVATYASCVGVDKSYIIPRDNNNRHGCMTNFVRDAHAAKLTVYPYTFRAENHFLAAEYITGEGLPYRLGNFGRYLQAFYASGIDGLFCDHPDIPIYLRTNKSWNPEMKGIV